MRVRFCLACGIMAVAPLLNCSNPTAPPPDPEPQIETTSSPTARPDPATGTAQQSAPTGHRPVPPAQIGNPEDLVGTTWVAGAHTFSFQAGGNFLVSGGNFDAFAPGGVPGILKIRKGVLEMRVMGRMNLGIWDGETLTINGIPAVRQEP